MSKFAAIEARATQYPASTNDVIWLVEQVRRLRDALAPMVDFPDALTQKDIDLGVAAIAALNEPNVP